MYQLCKLHQYFGIRLPYYSPTGAYHNNLYGVLRNLVLKHFQFVIFSIKPVSGQTIFAIFDENCLNKE